MTDKIIYIDFSDDSDFTAFIDDFSAKRTVMSIDKNIHFEASWKQIEQLSKSIDNALKRKSKIDEIKKINAFE